MQQIACFLHKVVLECIHKTRNKIKEDIKMKKFKSLFIAIMVLVTAVVATTILAGCTKYEFTKAVALKAEDQELEEYAFAVKKGNTEMLNKLNAFFSLDSTKELIENSLKYHTGVIQEKPIKASVLSDNTGAEITMVTEAGFAPYEYEGGGEGAVNQVIGVDVDLMIAFAEANNFKLKLKNTEFKSVIPEVSSNDMYIGAAGITVTEERKEKVDFANSYIKTIQYIISDQANSYKTIDQLAGLKVGFQASTTGQFVIEDFNKAVAEGEIDAKKIADKSYDKVMAAYQDLKNGKIAAIVIDEYVALGLVENDK